MNSSPQMIYPCVFGTSAGFELQDLQELPFKVRDLLVAITRSEVELNQDDACIKMLRIKANGQTYTWIGQYRKAYEMSFSREGGYYGAGVWLPEVTVNARQAVHLLDTLSRQVSRLALDAGKFQRTIASILHELLEVQSVKSAMRSLLESQTGRSPGGLNADAKGCAFIGQPHSFSELIDWAQTDLLAQNFQSIIVASPSAFPRAGASSSITQYATLSELERALDKDYSARIAKLEARNTRSELESKEWQKRAQSFESELNLRKAEIQTLKQRISALESSPQKTERSAHGKQSQSADDVPLMDREVHLSSPWIVAPISIFLSSVFTWMIFSVLQPGLPNSQGPEDAAGNKTLTQIDPKKVAPPKTQEQSVPADVTQAKPTVPSTSEIDDAIYRGTTTGGTIDEGSSDELTKKFVQVTEDPALSQSHPKYVLTADQRSVLLSTGDPSKFPIAEAAKQLDISLKEVRKQLEGKGYIVRQNGVWLLTPSGEIVFTIEVGKQ